MTREALGTAESIFRKREPPRELPACFSGSFERQDQQREIHSAEQEE
jgi:hypothetical protein